jgi:hypothetical protein
MFHWLTLRRPLNPRTLFPQYDAAAKSNSPTDHSYIVILRCGLESCAHLLGPLAPEFERKLGVLTSSTTPQAESDQPGNTLIKAAFDYLGHKPDLGRVWESVRRVPGGSVRGAFGRGVPALRMPLGH